MLPPSKTVVRKNKKNEGFSNKIFFSNKKTNFLFEKPAFGKSVFLKEKKVFENKNIANDPKNEPQKKKMFGEKLFLEIVFENFL